MIKSLSAICFIGVCAATTFACGQTSVDLGARYPTVIAYEVRPGILMTAKYDPNGQVCEMTLEKRHRLATKTDLGSIMPRETVRQLIDELVPVADRGKALKQYLRGNYESTISGNVEITEADFENVSIEIDGSVSSSCAAGDVVATIQWKKRSCRVPHP